MILERNKRIYHGSYMIVDKPDSAIRLLKPEKLTDQICVRTQKALEKLQFIKSEVYEITR